MAKMGRPPAEKPKDARIVVRMEMDLYAALKQWSEAHETAAPEIMRQALREFLKKHK